MDQIERPENIGAIHRRSRRRVRGFHGQRHPEENLRRSTSAGSSVKNQTHFQIFIAIFLLLFFFPLRPLFEIWQICHLMIFDDSFHIPPLFCNCSNKELKKDWHDFNFHPFWSSFSFSLGPNDIGFKYWIFPPPLRMAQGCQQF